MTLLLARQQSARTGGLRMVAVAAIVGLGLSLTGAAWLQSRLAVGCGYGGRSNGQSDLFCNAELMKFTPFIAVLLLGGLAVLMTVLIINATWSRPRERAWLLAAAPLAAALPVLVGGLLLRWHAATAADGTFYRLELWSEFAAAPLLAFLAACIAAAAGVRMRALAQGGRAAVALVLVAPALLALSVGLSAFGTFASAVIAAGIIGAAWGIAATAPAPAESAAAASAPAEAGAPVAKTTA